MSASNEIDVTCPECEEDFKGLVWTAIHAGQHPELKEVLLGGELNVLVCPKCARTFLYEHFLLYQEPRLKLVAYVYPHAEELRKAELEVLMNKGFTEAQDTFPLKDRLRYGPILMFGLDQLKDHINLEEKQLLETQVSKALERKPT